MKKNIHKAVNVKISKVLHSIEHYPKQYSTPKYLLFIKDMLELGYEVKLYVAKLSKYVFVTKDGTTHKIRFSNHRPIKEKELEEDCDFYVGKSNFQCSTTEQIKERIVEGKTKEQQQYINRPFAELKLKLNGYSN